MSNDEGAGGAPAAVPTDPAALLRSREYRVILVMAAIVGIVVSVASWAFLELVHGLQVGIYEELPDALGFDEMPLWWPVPWLVVGGLLAAIAIVRLPGKGGHVPYEGMKGGAIPPVDLPGVLLAALASLGFGFVLGPEGPLLALATGLAVLAVRSAKKDTPDQAMAVLSASAAFAALASVFGSPLIGTIILIEAAGLGGPMLPLVLLPGLMSAGIGSLVFVGLGSWTGLDNSNHALQPFSLAPFSTPTLAQLGWAVGLAVAAAVFTWIVVAGARMSGRFVARRPLVLMPAVGLAVALVAMAFDVATDESELGVLFSGQEAFGELFADAAGLSTATLLVLVACKGVAWSLSLGSFRGGPTFPALFLGAVGGLAVADLPGLGQTPAVVILMAAMAVSILRLPLSALIVTLLLTSSAGITTAPLAIVATVVAYLTTLGLTALSDRSAAAPALEQPT